MNVLVVYAHFNPNSFTHAILESVTRGLDESPHSYKVSDLNAIGFNPVFTAQDSTQFLHESYPDHLLETANLPQAVMDLADGPIRRYMARRWRVAKGLARSPRRSMSRCRTTCASNRRSSARPMA